MTTENEMFNVAINYALDYCTLSDGEGLVFLNLWREGEWDKIADEFPDFDLSMAPTNPEEILNETT